MTNGEKFRAMTNEQLAEFMKKNLVCTDEVKANRKDCFYGACKACWWNWLEKEVEEQ